MNEGVKYTGVPAQTELEAVPGTPSLERLEKGPVAFIECVQEIPCNPCEKACPFGAITIGESITNLPTLNEEKCTGCGVCMSACPGLAIFIIDLSYSKETGLVEFPYEYYPLPKIGDIVPCGNRSGKYLVEGKVLKVKNNKKMDHTATITVEIPKNYCLEVRTICRIKEGLKDV
ncbi:MAG: 4Fe-4S ferredoxin [Peptococcaceae bacterium BICA1-8]|nr:MAG: 4Fe-4S ferredoxin [Peptococcaceae bacterium BICA1-8]